MPRSNEAGVIFPVFIRPGIDVGGTVGPHVRGREWTSDGYVHSQTLSVGPERDRDVPRSPTGSRTENPLLLENRRQKALGADPLDQVPHAVMPHDVVPVPSAAPGVIAVTIKVLLAEGAGAAVRNNPEAQTVGDGHLEDLGPHHAVRTLHRGGDSRDKRASVGLGNPKEA